MEIAKLPKYSAYVLFAFFVLLVPYTVFAPSDWFVSNTSGLPIKAEKRPAIEKRGDLYRVPIFLTTSGKEAIGIQIVWQYDVTRFQVVRISTSNSPFYVEPPGFPMVRSDIGQLQIAAATKRFGWNGQGVIGFVEGYLLQAGATQLVPVAELTKLWVRNGDGLDRVALPVDTVTIGGGQ